MASKRKRRRQAARHAARRALKVEKEQQMTTSAGKVYKDYKVAVQKKSTDVMNVFTVREHDQNNLLPFIARIQEVDDVKDLAHLDIHLQLDNGDVQIIYESSPEWPKGVQVKRNEGFIVRGRDRVLSVKSTTAKPKTTTVPALPAVIKHDVPPGVELIFFKRYSTAEIKLTTTN